MGEPNIAREQSRALLRVALWVVLYVVSLAIAQYIFNELLHTPNETV